jgi:DNA-binding NarL/FixJ family response regulator
MALRIAVTDPLPVFRRGVTAILRDAGLEPEAPPDPLAWLDDWQTAALIVTLLSEPDWQLLEALHTRATTTILIALLEEVTAETTERALRAGAVSVLPRSTSPATLVENFTAAVNGLSIVPVEVLRNLLAAGPSMPPDTGPSAQERQWLQSLSQGSTVGRLAFEAGYSERMMFRLLRGVYNRMGAHGRTDALVKAQAMGWIKP